MNELRPPTSQDMRELHVIKPWSRNIITHGKYQNEVKLTFRYILKELAKVSLI